MLTPDQVRLRLEKIQNEYGTESALYLLADLLADVLPDLVASATQPQLGAKVDDVGARYRSEQ